MLDADVDALGQNSVLDALVDDNPNGAARHVEDAARLAVVRLVCHTLLLRTCRLRHTNSDTWYGGAARDTRMHTTGVNVSHCS